jgi:formyltetrahydrofolate deformylase
MSAPHYILTLSCPDVRGIVAAVTGFLSEQDGFIHESAQFGDPSTQRFFMRVDFSAGPKTPAEEALKKLFHQQVGGGFSMDWHIHDKLKKPRLLIMVSRIGHCLNDLLYRYRTGQLAVEIPAVVSNHPDFKSIVEWHNIPFFHLGTQQQADPKRPSFGHHANSKEAREVQILDIIAHHAIDTVVLARYMQILSPGLCEKLAGQAINIHHSFLPSFKGARPYHQAYDRGVKLIGATSHYVTPELDEGPIIEQEVARVDHAHSPQDLAAIGRDIECQVLSRALKLHIEHRVLPNGHKTVVFK